MYKTWHFWFIHRVFLVFVWAFLGWKTTSGAAIECWSGAAKFGVELHRILRMEELSIFVEHWGIAVLAAPEGLQHLGLFILFCCFICIHLENQCGCMFIFIILPWQNIRLVLECELSALAQMLATRFLEQHDEGPCGNVEGSESLLN